MCIRVSVNGEPVDTVLSLMDELGCGVGGIVSAVTGEPLERAAYDECLCRIDIAATDERNGFRCAESDEPGVDYELTNQA